MKKLKELGENNNIIKKYLESSKNVHKKSMIDFKNILFDENLKNAKLNVTFTNSQCGYENIIHGGVTVLNLEDITGIHALVLASLYNKIALTREMKNIIFFKKIPPKRRVILSSKLIKAEDNKIICSGSIIDKEDLSRYAECTSIFVKKKYTI